VPIVSAYPPVLVPVAPALPVAEPPLVPIPPAPVVPADPTLEVEPVLAVEDAPELAPLPLPAATLRVQDTTTRSPVLKSRSMAPAAPSTRTVVVPLGAVAPVVPVPVRVRVAGLSVAVPPTDDSRRVTVRAVASTATTSAAKSPDVAAIGGPAAGDP